MNKSGKTITFGEFIEEQMKGCGMNKNDFCEEFGYTHAECNRLLKNKLQLDRFAMMKIAEYFCCNVDFLLMMQNSRRKSFFK